MEIRITQSEFESNTLSKCIYVGKAVLSGNLTLNTYFRKEEKMTSNELNS